MAILFAPPPRKTAISLAREHVKSVPYSSTQVERRLRRIANRFTGVNDRLEDDCPLGILSLDEIGRLGALSARLAAARRMAQLRYSWKSSHETAKQRVNNETF